MGGREVITETVFDQEQYGSDWPPGELPDAIAWFQEMLERIPEECRDSARLEISSERDYDGHTPRITITYYREETDEEVEARRERQEERRIREEQAALETFRRLQAHFDPANVPPEPELPPRRRKVES